MVYYAHIYHEDNDTYSVEFPDLEGCFSMGETLEEAIVMAREALNGFLDTTNIEFAKPKNYDQPDYYPIKVDAHIAFALQLRWYRQENRLTQSQMADRIGILYQAYQRLEDPRKSSASLKTLTKVERHLAYNFNI